MFSSNLEYIKEDDFFEKDCELLKRRDFHDVDALLKMRKKGNNKETFRIFDKVKKTLNSSSKSSMSKNYLQFIY